MSSSAPTLRPHQSAAVAAVLEDLRVHPSTLIVHPTGSGKSVTAGALIERWHAEGLRTLVICPAHLVDQFAGHAARIVGDLGVTIEQGGRRACDTSAVVVASVPTLKGKRLHRYPADAFDRIVIDECFPAGTLIDGRPIESLRVGDTVESVDHATGRIVERRITRTFKSRAESLCMVNTEHGESIVCTPGHPFYVPGRGYTNAVGLVEEGPGVQLVRKYVPMEVQEDLLLGGVQGIDACRSPEGSDLAVCWLRDRGEAARQATATGPHGASVLLGWVPRVGRLEDLVGDDGEDESAACLGPDEEEQPHASPGVTREDGVNSPGDRPQTADPRRERQRSDRARATAIGCARVADASDREDGQEARVGLPVPLQSGRGESRTEDRYRGRWGIARDTQAEGAGREEGCFVALSGVASVEVLEPGSDGRFGGLCPDGHVYNIEVEETHNYFANGILVHNCHHARAESWLAAVEHFDRAKIVGLTATPDRADGKSLVPSIFSTCSHQYTIREAIADGYLVPIRYTAVTLDGVDLSRVRRTGGDYAAGALGRAMLSADAATETIVERSAALVGSRKTVVFAVTIEHAEVLAKAYRDAGHTAIAVSSQTPAAERAEAERAFESGEIQYLVNVGVYCEGWDHPPVSAIILARPTQSRALYTQQIGRGLRPSPNTGKKDCVIVDFAGGHARHSLIHAYDVLIPGLSPDLVSVLEDLAEDGEVELSESTLVIAVEEAARRAEARQREIDILAARYPTADQLEELEDLGVEPTRAAELDRDSAQAVIGLLRARRADGYSTIKQARRLAIAGTHPVDALALTYDRASLGIRTLADNRWRRPLSWGPRQTEPSPAAVARVPRVVRDLLVPLIESR